MMQSKNGLGRLKLRATWFLFRSLISRLPDKFLCAMARRFDTPGHFECSVDEGSSWWMDASYAKWCRMDMRREKRANPHHYY